MKELYIIVTDKQLCEAWGSANFGKELSMRDVVKLTLLKRASHYHCGHTARAICIDLGLLTPKKEILTSKGGKYLWSAYSEGSNF